MEQGPTENCGLNSIWQESDALVEVRVVFLLARLEGRTSFQHRDTPGPDFTRPLMVTAVDNRDYNAESMGAYLARLCALLYFPLAPPLPAGRAELYHCGGRRFRESLQDVCATVC